MEQQLMFTDATFPENLRCQAAAFRRIVWPWVGSGAGRNTKHSWSEDLEARYFVIVDNGILISHASVIRRTLSHAHTDYLVGELASMFTYPQFRREGYGRRVVHAATSYIQSSGLDVGWLTIEPTVGLEAFYQAEGWIAMPEARTLTGDPAHPTIEEEHPMLPAVRMMFFVTPKGQAGQQAFAQIPVYIGMWYAA